MTLLGQALDALETLAGGGGAPETTPEAGATAAEAMDAAADVAAAMALDVLQTQPEPETMLAHPELQPAPAAWLDPTFTHMHSHPELQPAPAAWLGPLAGAAAGEALEPLESDDDDDGAADGSDDEGPLPGLRRRTARGAHDDAEGEHAHEDACLERVEYEDSDGAGSDAQDDAVAVEPPKDDAQDGAATDGVVMLHATGKGGAKLSKQVLANLTPAMLATRGQAELSSRLHVRDEMEDAAPLTDDEEEPHSAYDDAPTTTRPRMAEGCAPVPTTTRPRMAEEGAPVQSVSEEAQRRLWSAAASAAPTSGAAEQSTGCKGGGCKGGGGGGGGGGGRGGRGGDVGTGSGGGGAGDGGGVHGAAAPDGGFDADYYNEQGGCRDHDDAEPGMGYVAQGAQEHATNLGAQSTQWAGALGCEPQQMPRQPPPHDLPRGPQQLTVVRPAPAPALALHACAHHGALPFPTGETRARTRRRGACGGSWAALHACAHHGACGGSWAALHACAHHGASGGSWAALGCAGRCRGGGRRGRRGGRRFGGGVARLPARARHDASTALTGRERPCELRGARR